MSLAFLLSMILRRFLSQRPLNMYLQIIGGGIPVGSLVMIMEDNEAPHHMLFLRYFMAQGLVHSQPLLFASPLPSPQAFLGTLPAIASARDSKSRSMGPKDSSHQVLFYFDSSLR